jgi:hypothetical protein
VVFIYLVLLFIGGVGIFIIPATNGESDLIDCHGVGALMFLEMSGPLITIMLIIVWVAALLFSDREVKRAWGANRFGRSLANYPRICWTCVVIFLFIIFLGLFLALIYFWPGTGCT